MRTVELVLQPSSAVVRLIDQTALPDEVRMVECGTIAEVADAIRTMKVRGAPAIGATAAYGLALAAETFAVDNPDDPGPLMRHLKDAADLLKATRPTAVNLAWAVDRVTSDGIRAIADATNPNVGSVERIRRTVVASARTLADEDVETNLRMGAHGAALIPADASILTHCNTGSLATVEYGTALGVIRAASEAGRNVHVYVDETRPFLQGARLTAWELQQAGIPHTLISDNMAGHFMMRGAVDLAIVGADRIAANGDVANKIGTYTLAVLCKENGLPFYVAAPTSTVDLALPSGDAIPIEERSQDEVTHIAGRRIAPEGTRAAHPAFDVTPHRYVTAIVTERGIVRAPFEPALREAVAAADADRQRAQKERRVRP